MQPIPISTKTNTLYCKCDWRKYTQLLYIPISMDLWFTSIREGYLNPTRPFSTPSSMELAKKNWNSLSLYAFNITTACTVMQ